MKIDNVKKFVFESLREILVDAWRVSFEGPPYLAQATGPPFLSHFLDVSSSNTNRPQPVTSPRSFLEPLWGSVLRPRC